METYVKKRAKMNFIMTALDNGWSIKKRGEQYIFKKKHENRREVYEEAYLENFIVSNSAHPCSE
jgi:hypothetical protein